MKKLTIKTFLLFLLAAFLGCTPKTEEETPGDKQALLKEKPAVKIMVLEKGSFKKQLVANGKLKALRKGDLSFRQQGVITKIATANGYNVSNDEVIAALDKTNYLENLKTAQANLDRARFEMEDMFIGLGINPEDSASLSKEKLMLVKIKSGYLNAQLEYEKTVKNLKDCELRAPFSGKVANIAQKEYEQTNGKPFCTLIDDSRFEVLFHIMENEMNDVAVNDPVQVLPFALDIICLGKISEINPVVDENGLIGVKAVVNNPGTLMEGMNVRVLIEKEVPNQFVVPKSAVVLRDNFEVLFKIINGKAYWNYVNTIYENTESFAVIPNPEKSTASLEVGDTIIVSGNLNLAHESEVEFE
ncbi:MAG: efflux RND transporter periplasmic adaptor subunit [Prolixibacteraceae bacterium]|nr:efflux RND transporter periplasmic adaptor subunit [Prolixibacteraceae bacterium]